MTLQDPLMFKLFCVFFGPIWCLILMRLGYKLFDNITSFKTNTQLLNNNTAVGFVVGSIFIGMGLCTGLVVGLALF